MERSATTTQYRRCHLDATTYACPKTEGSNKTIQHQVEGGTIRATIFNDTYPNGRDIRTEQALEADIRTNQDYKCDIEIDYNNIGQITKEYSRHSGSVNYAYDGFGNLLSQTGTDRNVSYTYDVAGNITGITYPDGTSISREIDLAGRITSVTDWAGDSYQISYNAAGQIASLTSSTGLSYDAVYDGNRLVSKTWSDELDGVIASFENSYQDNGLLATDSKAMGDEPADTRDFQFTDNGALAAVNDTEITWDARLLTSTGNTALAYNAATSQLETATQESSATAYTYDQQGNRLSATTDGSVVGYQWNDLNQLTALDGTEYLYGANGIRTSVDGNQQVYDQDLKLLADGQMKYLWSPDGALLAQAPLGSTDSTQTQQAATDGMNSVYAVLDSQMAVLAKYSYTAFGERTLTAGADVSTMGYTSEQHDASGLIYLRYRYMDPTIGQFISVDPMLNSTLDAYGYASGNPLQVTDPLGLFSWGEVGSWLYDNAGTISTVLSVAAIAASATGVGAPVGLALGALSAGFAFTSAHKNFSEGNTAAGWLDVASGALGASAIVAGIKTSATVAKTIANGAQSRAQIKAATKVSETIRTSSDDASLGLLAATTAGKGVIC